MKKEHFRIWSNIGLDFDEWRDDLEAEYPDLDEDALCEKMYEINDDYLDDERSNLDVDVGQPILVIADLGTWNGRINGYKEIDSGNISGCLNACGECDYIEWYVDELGDLRANMVHHDGVNYLLYRAYKPGVTERQRRNLKDKILDKKVTRADITRLTKRLGDEIADVYGWTLKGRKYA